MPTSLKKQKRNEPPVIRGTTEKSSTVLLKLEKNQSDRGRKKKKGSLHNTRRDRERE